MPKIFLLLLVSISPVLFSGCTSSNSYVSPHTGDNYDYVLENNDQVTSDNWDCTEDCSGHEAGYEWAEDNGITDTEDCGGNSDSFIEGCETYVSESQEGNFEQDSYYEYEYY